MKYLYLVLSLLLSINAFAGDFKSTTRSSTDNKGTTTTTTYSTNGTDSSRTTTTTFENGSTSTKTTTYKNGKKKVTRDGSNGGDHAESGARDAGASKEQAEEVAKKHRFCQQNPNHEDCKKSNSDSSGNSLYEPSGEPDKDNPLILR